MKIPENTIPKDREHDAKNKRLAQLNMSIDSNGKQFLNIAKEAKLVSGKIDSKLKIME